MYTRGGSIYARRAADARPVTGTARPSRGGGGGRRLATVTPILDLPLGGWGEPGFNWRLFWGTPDAMLWKITDNVKYEEDCEVSWAQGRTLAPPEYSPGGGGRWTQVWARAWEQRAGTSLCPSMGRGPLFRMPPSPFLRGSLPELGLFLNIHPREQGLEREWQIPPTRLTGRCPAKQNSPSSLFLGRASRLQSLDVAFTHRISVQRGQTRRPAGDTFAESPPRRAYHPPR